MPLAVERGKFVSHGPWEVIWHDGSVHSVELTQYHIISEEGARAAGDFRAFRLRGAELTGSMVMHGDETVYMRLWPRSAGAAGSAGMRLTHRGGGEFEVVRVEDEAVEPISCGLDETVHSATAPQREALSARQGTNSRSFDVVSSVNIHLIANKDFVDGSGGMGSVQSVLLGFLAEVNTLYQDEVGLTFISTNLETTLSSDNSNDLISTVGDSANGLLEACGRWLNETASGSCPGCKRGVVPGVDPQDFAIASCFGTLPQGGGFSGVAWVGTACDSASRAYYRVSGNMFGVPGGGLSVGTVSSGATQGLMHEIGHNFNAQHSYNSNIGFCGGQRSPTGAHEPGSGSTIMGYSVCGADNLQEIKSSSTVYFHSFSLEQVMGQILGQQQAEPSCFVNYTNSGSPPPLSVPANGLTVPRSAAFRLSVSGPTGVGVEYNIEHNQLAGRGSSLAQGDLGNVPLFRSFQPQAPNVGPDTFSKSFPTWPAVPHDAPSNAKPWWQDFDDSPDMWKGDLPITSAHPGGIIFTMRGRIADDSNSLVDYVVSVDPDTALFVHLVGPDSPMEQSLDSAEPIAVYWGHRGSERLSALVDIIFVVDDPVLGTEHVALAGTENDGLQAVAMPDTISEGDLFFIEVRGVDQPFFCSKGPFNASISTFLEPNGTYPIRPIPAASSSAAASFDIFF